MKNHEPSQPPTVAIALMVAFILSAGFIGIVAVVLPGVLLMLVSGVGMLLFFVAQYFLWARWMFPIVQRWEREQNPEATDSLAPPERKQ